MTRSPYSNRTENLRTPAPTRPCERESTKSRQTGAAVAMYLALLGFSACSFSPAEPSSSQPTLNVTNPLCDSGGCRTVQLRAFVWTFLVPQPGIGLKAIREIHGETACVLFPPSWELVVSGFDSSGTAVSSTMVWTPDDALYLTILDLESGEFLSASETFVPGEASAWQLTFDPAAVQEPLPFSAHLSQSQRCEPL